MLLCRPGQRSRRCAFVDDEAGLSGDDSSDDDDEDSDGELRDGFIASQSQPEDGPGMG